MNNLSCIGPIITSSPNSFQNTSTFSYRVIWLSKLAVTVWKTSLKTAPKKLRYRNNKKFYAADFKTELNENLAGSSSTYDNFKQAFLALLDKHASYKSKKIRANCIW